jgi:heme exporter protein A
MQRPGSCCPFDVSEPHAIAVAPSLSASRLACRRGHRMLFRGLDLSLEPGQIMWLRGQNGRGKTSLLRLAAGLSAPEEGVLSCDGMALRRLPDFALRLLFIGHTNALKDDLSVSEALAFLLRIHGRPSDTASVHAALQRLGMHSRRDAPVRTLSQGQRRRVALARLAVEQHASLWLLDEPFDALDADGVERVNGLLLEHLARRGSVLLTSHLRLDDSLPALVLDLDAHA